MATYTDLKDETLEKREQNIGGMGVADHLNQYGQAMNRLTAVKDNLPTYDKTYDSALQSLFDDLANYEKFQYDSRGDALYQAYKQSYTDAGKMAMMDTMGQASALTGGYGSSYGQAVGQQQYSAYLQKLNDVLPETYGMAYRQHQDGRNALQEQYNMTQQLADDEYRKYQDRLGAYYKELGYWQDAADTAYNRYQNAEQQAYDRQQDAYDRLADMIVNTGYVPDADDLAAAGMKDREYQAYLNYFNMMNAPSASSSGGGRRSSKKKKNEEDNSRYDEMLAEQKKMIDLGKSIEVINGGISNNAVSNGLSVEETRRIMEELTNYAVSKGKV